MTIIPNDDQSEESKQKLTPKQEAFIREYLLDFNATAAAERAGYQGNRTTLSAIGSENLAKPAIRDRINQAIEGWAMSSREVLYRLSRHARGSMADFISETPTGDVKFDLQKAHRMGVLDQVKYMSHDERWDDDVLIRNRFEISLYDSLAALSRLAKAYNLTGGALAEMALLPDSTVEQIETPEEKFQQFLTAAKIIDDWEKDTFGHIVLSDL